MYFRSLDEEGKLKSKILWHSPFTRYSPPNLYNSSGPYLFFFFCQKIVLQQFCSLSLMSYVTVTFKGTQAWNFFLTFFAETEIIWSQGPVTWDFWKSYSIRLRYSTFKHFSSKYAKHAMKLVPRMLSVR